MSKSGEKANKVEPGALDELDRCSAIMPPSGSARRRQGEALSSWITDPSCPRCGAHLRIVGLHYLQTRWREDGWPQEHVHLACLSPGCGFQDCAVVGWEPLWKSLDIGATAATGALAQMLGYRDHHPGEDPPGVVRGLQVRWSSWPQAGLIVHEEDADDAIFVLVTGTFPTYEARGWSTGREAKQAVRLEDHGDRDHVDDDHSDGIAPTPDERSTQ